LNIGKIRSLAAEGRYEYSKHAERERELDMIYTWELEDALRNGEIIETYPERKLFGFGVLWLKTCSCSLHDKNRFGRAVPYYCL